MNSWRHKCEPPSDDDIQQGIEYRFQLRLALDSHGSILVDPGTTRWHYQPEPVRSVYSVLNLIRKPDFVLLDHGEREVLRIRQQSRLPRRFNILQHGEIVGTIALMSVLRSKYTITLAAGPTWTFRMPLFTLRFYGESSVNSRVWVLVGPHKTQWSLLAQPGTDDVRLVASLAFIHREWWVC